MSADTSQASCVFCEIVAGRSPASVVHEDHLCLAIMTIEPVNPGHLLVFVGGLHRSGTTPLARALSAHPDISGFSNTGVPEDEGQHLQDVYPPAYVLGGPGRFARKR